MSNQKKQWGAIIIMIALFAMIAFVTNLCTPMATIIKAQGDISNVLAQIGNYGNFVAYLVMGIPAGMLISKYGYKKSALIGLAVGAVGILIQWLSGMFDAKENLGLVFGVYLAGAFIAGLCMCILNCVVNPMLNILGGGGKSGNQLIQIGGVFNSTAAVACYILMGALIGEAAKAKISDATPALMIALAIFVIAFIIILRTKIEEPKTEKVDLGMVKKALGYRHFALGALAIFLYMGIEVGVPNYVQQYLSTENAEVLTERAEILKQYEAKDITLDQATRMYLNAGKENTDEAKEVSATVVIPNAITEIIPNDSTKTIATEIIPDAITDVIPDNAAVGLDEKEFNKTKKEIENGTLTSEKVASKFPGLGIPSGTVGMIVAVYWFMMLIGRFVGASIGSKVSSRAMVTTVSIATLVLVLFGMYAPAIDVPFPGVDWGKLELIWQDIPVGIFAFLLVGLCTSVMWGAIFNMAVEGLGKYTAIASGIFMTMVFGCAVMMGIQGFMADSLGYIPSFWVVVFCAAYILFYALVGSRPAKK